MNGDVSGALVTRQTSLPGAAVLRAAEAAPGPGRRAGQLHDGRARGERVEWASQHGPPVDYTLPHTSKS